MDVNASDREVIEKVTAAMQAGPSRVDDMLALFTPDAVLIEPFSGQIQTHEGIDAISERYRTMVAEPRPPDFRLHVDRVDTDGTEVITDWTCTSAVFPGPMKGESRYIIRSGKIQRLSIRIVG